MIRHIAGTVHRIEETSIIVDVHGVGYQIFVSRPSDFSLEQAVTLHTHHVVRETAADLYGFSTMDELELFELLLALPKIGPKSAAQILGQADLELITAAVMNNDPEHLTKMSGIGKKTAEKIVVGLKDSLAARSNGDGTLSPDSNDVSTWQRDAIDALISLGYPHSEARTIIQKLPKNVTNVNDAVKHALKELGQS